MRTINIYFNGKWYLTYPEVAKELKLRDGQEILTTRFMKLIVSTHNEYEQKLRTAKPKRYSESDFVPNNQ